MILCDFRTALIVSLASLAGTCGDGGVGDSVAHKMTAAEAKAIEGARDCGRDAQEQIACLQNAFEVEECADAEVLNSMFLENASHAELHYSTVFWAGPECHSALHSAAMERGFEGRNWLSLYPFDLQGYRETLDFYATTEWEGGKGEKEAFVWERVKE